MGHPHPKVFGHGAIHGFGYEGITWLDAEQSLQIGSGIEDHLLQRFAFPQSCFGHLLLGNVETVTGDFERSTARILHQPEFIVSPAVLAALGSEAVIVAVGAILEHQGKMAVDCSDVVGMNMVRPESWCVHELFRIVPPQRPDTLRHESAGEIASRLTNEHGDGAGVDQRFQPREVALPGIQTLRQ
ncbi:MAG TPA: hypothetical protein VK686_04480 [Bryobacteraceae bacterium]|nr:hypothetical protein [Bryobacteraceae bacterium]